MPNNARNNARAKISEILGAAKFWRSARDLVVKDPKNTLQFHTENAAARGLIKSARDFKDNSDLDMLHRGLAIQVFAAFEEFVRNAVILRLNYVEAGDCIPKQVLTNNLYFTGKALAMVHVGMKDRALDLEELARNIGTCYVEDLDTILNKQAFTSFFAGVTVHSVDDLLKKCGLNNIWAQVSKRKEVKRALGTKQEKETQKELERRLEAFSKIRNGIAHGSSGLEPVTETMLDEIVAIYDSLVVAMSDVIESNQ